jgi:predicted TIM-barrel fold metal-dependent hydrolase
VVVESGVGWLPFAVTTMDWIWQNCGVSQEHPEFELLPTEYFRRQVYGCFWFEKATLKAAVEQLGDRNFLYETDFPHPTSMSPVRGLDSVAVSPKEYIDSTLSDLPQSSVEKLLHGNAARIYHLD